MATTAEQIAAGLGERTNFTVTDAFGFMLPLRRVCNRAKATANTVEESNGDMHTTYTFPDGSSIVHHVPNVGDCYWTLG